MTIQDGFFECELCGKSTTGEYNTDTGNHTACEELATLRAQLAEAREIVIVLAYIDNMLSPEESHEFISVNIRTSVIKKARAWYTKATTA